jgi:hypothetical protein
MSLNQLNLPRTIQELAETLPINENLPRTIQELAKNSPSTNAFSKAPGPKRCAAVLRPWAAFNGVF